jgi:cyclic pyranopterin phosphate synthase
MVDVGGKNPTLRVAHARAVVELPEPVAKRFQDGDLVTAKGSVFHTAILAGVMAAKKTSELIPLCHPIGLDHCSVDIGLESGNQAVVDCRCRVHHRTGVEMEALTGASVAALTIYDMCKGLSHDIRISSVHLVEKTGGKQDVRPPPPKT